MFKLMRFFGGIIAFVLMVIGAAVVVIATTQTGFAQTFDSSDGVSGGFASAFQDTTVASQNEWINDAGAGVMLMSNN